MSILIFAIVFFLTILLQRWLHQHIQAFALALTGNPGCAVRLLFYLLLPGIILHEMSHYLAARLLFVRTGGINLGVGRAGRKHISLGSVTIARSDPVRTSLIGVAPFLVGIGAIWLIAGAGFDLWPNAGPTFEQMASRLIEYSHDWTTWLDVYLIFAVSTAMIPSESDREPWGPAVTVLGSLVAVLLLMGWTPRMPGEWVLPARRLLDALIFALGIAVIVNGMVAVLLWLVEQVVALFSRHRVVYPRRGR
jgi:hypothetical protein